MNQLSPTPKARRFPTCDAVDEALITHLKASELLQTERVRSNEGEGWTPFTTRSPSSQAACDRAKQIVEKALQPADLSELLAAVEILGASVAPRRDMDTRQITLWASAIARAMLEYPGDCALEALRDWPKSENGKWMPTENEIREQAGRRAKFRFGLKMDLDCWREAQPPREVQPWERVHDEPIPGRGHMPLMVEVAQSERIFHDVPAHELIFYGARYGWDFIEMSVSMKNLLEREYPGLAEKHGLKLKERVI